MANDVAVVGLVKKPALRCCVCTSMLNVVSAGTWTPTLGFVIIAVTMLVCAGILPMGMPLQDPVLICIPLVISEPSQKLMKFALSLVVN
jgi:hypothetical protein